MVGGAVDPPLLVMQREVPETGPLPPRTNQAVLTHRPAMVCLDKAFVLIEGQPVLGWIGRKAKAGPSLRLKNGYGQDDTSLCWVEGSAIPGPNGRDPGHPSLWRGWPKSVFGNGQLRSGAVSL
jgi:hypothetical protein